MKPVRHLAAIVVILAFAPVSRVAAQPAARPAAASSLKPAALVHLQAGMKLYEEEHYVEAIAELRAGLAIDPQPDILYALGQAERKRGDCKRAVEYYQSCLALVKDPAAPCTSLDYDFTNTSVPPAGKPFGPNSFLWDFGDNSPQVPDGTGSLSHSFPGAGTYTLATAT